MDKNPSVYLGNEVCPGHVSLGDLFPHANNCGHCEYGRILTEERRRWFGPCGDGTEKATKDDWLAYEAAVESRWDASKYRALWREVTVAGGAWVEFKARCDGLGWEP